MCEIKARGCFLGLVWIFIVKVLLCYCQKSTLTPVDPDVIEGNNIDFVCTVPDTVNYVNWVIAVDATTTYTAAMAVQNGTCALSPSTSFLSNTTKHSYNCNSTVYQVTVKNVQGSQHNNVWSCFPAGQSSGPTSTINVQVPVSSVSISPSSNIVEGIENTTVICTCQTSVSRPNASVTWYKVESGVTSQINKNVTSSTASTDGYVSVTTSTLRFVPSRQQDVVDIFCIASNIINISHVDSSKLVVNVLYPPSSLSFYYGNLSGPMITDSIIDVIEGETITLACKSNDGNPESKIRWNGQDEDDHLLTVQQVQESLTSKTCTASNTMRGTDGEVKNGSISETINFNILISPNITGCNLYYVNKANSVLEDIDDIQVIENESFRIICSAVGLPLPNSSWSLPWETFSSPSVTITNVTRQQGGYFEFSATSFMQQSFEKGKTATDTMTITVEILFPPTVLEMNNIVIVEGSKIVRNCSYIVGSPEETAVKWIRDFDKRKWNDSQLLISPVSREDKGNYVCIITNTMRPSGDIQPHFGESQGGFYLDVHYKTDYMSFGTVGFTETTVVVNENDTVHFKCIANGNPTPNITVRNLKEDLKSVVSGRIEYILENASCSDTGQYICSARNKYNVRQGPIKHILLFVRCLPRSADMVVGNQSSKINASFTFTYNAIAYPVPSFTWWILDTDKNQWNELTNSEGVTIQSSDLQSNLTITKATMKYFTKFKLDITNDIGTTIQHYSLAHYDKPETPTGLQFVEDRTTSASIHLEWKPGFNGGPEQTFHIKYKNSSTETWNYINITDTSEDIMSYTMTGLTENTQYNIVIYASNILGQSAESNSLIVLTKIVIKIQEENEDTTSMVGIYVGIATGCVILILLFIFSVWRCRSKPADPDVRTVSTRNVQVPIVRSSECVYYNEGIISTYESLDTENEDVSNYSVLDTPAPEYTQNDRYENMNLKAF